jgi:hypothetical protein
MIKIRLLPSRPGREEAYGQSYWACFSQEADRTISTWTCCAARESEYSHASRASRRPPGYIGAAWPVPFVPLRFLLLRPTSFEHAYCTSKEPSAAINVQSLSLQLCQHRHAMSLKPSISYASLLHRETPHTVRGSQPRHQTAIPPLDYWRK